MALVLQLPCDALQYFCQMFFLCEVMVECLAHAKCPVFAWLRPFGALDRAVSAGLCWLSSVVILTC